MKKDVKNLVLYNIQNINFDNIFQIIEIGCDRKLNNQNFIIFLHYIIYILSDIFCSFKKENYMLLFLHSKANVF